MTAKTFAVTFALSVFFTVGCTPRPDAGIAERPIRAHFEERGYVVKEISIGKISRNPVAERVYMGPLTYVVEVKSITLEKEGSSAGELSFSAASVKISARSAPQKGWVVSQISGIDLP